MKKKEHDAKANQMTKEGLPRPNDLPVLRARCVDTGAWGTHFHIQRACGGGFPPEAGGGVCGFVVVLGEFVSGEFEFGELGFVVFWLGELGLFGEFELGGLLLGEFVFPCVPCFELEPLGEDCEFG